MGNISGKIDPRRRIKIHKRVNLAEARKQFAKLKQIDKTIDLSAALNRPPISVNFYTTFGDQGLFSTTSYWTLSDSLDELDGEKCFRYEVLFLLEGEFRTAKIADYSNYFIGLDKEQHDTLYPPHQPASAAST